MLNIAKSLLLKQAMRRARRFVDREAPGILERMAGSGADPHATLYTLWRELIAVMLRSDAWKLENLERSLRHESTVKAVDIVQYVVEGAGNARGLIDAEMPPFVAKIARVGADPSIVIYLLWCDLTQILSTRWSFGELMNALHLEADKVASGRASG